MKSEALETIDILKYKCGIQYLKDLLASKCKQNLSYSLRAFAAQLKISPTALSHLLNRKKKLTLSMSQILLAGLNIKNKKEHRYLKALFAFELAVGEDEKSRLEAQLAAMSPFWCKAKVLGPSKSNVLDQWFYLATLEFISIPQLNHTSDQIAHRLEITNSQVDEALTVLEAIGLIRRTKTNSYERTEKQILLESQNPNAKLQSYHRQTLALARKALSAQSNDRKLVGSETFSLAPEDLIEAKEIVENCFQQILALAQRSQNRTDIYHLGIQLFSLTRELK